MSDHKVISLFVCTIMIATAFSTVIPAAGAPRQDKQHDADNMTGNTTPGYPEDTGLPEAVAWRPITPLNTATLIGYDPESYHDDLSYLAAIPHGIFMEDEHLYSSPVIFYDSPYQGGGDPERTLDHNKGINYFMDDWVTACGGNLSRAVLLNLGDVQRQDMESTSQWFDTIEDVWEVNNTNARETAYKLALDGWESSDKAVIAVVSSTVMNDLSNYAEPVGTGGSVEGVIPAGKIATLHMEGSKSPDPQDPNYHNFTVEPGYKFMEVEMEWSDHAGGEVTERGRDPDMQVYDWQLGEVEASCNWNVLSGPHEYAECYIYHDYDEAAYEESGGDGEKEPAPWGVAVTYMPTEAMPMWDGSPGAANDMLRMYGYDESEAAELAAAYFERERPSSPSMEMPPSPIAADANPGDEGAAHGRSGDRPFQDRTDQTSDETDYRIDVTMYVGADVELDRDSPFMARDVSFTLSWNTADELKFLVRGPSGAEIPFQSGNTGGSPITLELRELGEGTYSISAICMEDSNPDIPFTVEYEFNQYYPESYGDSFAAAANGAVLASMENAPLLFSTGDELDSGLEHVLDTLGVTKVYLVSLMKSSGLEEDLDDKCSTPTRRSMERSGPRAARTMSCSPR